MDGRPSLADAYIFNMLGEHVSELGVKGDPFMNLAETNKVLESFPRLRVVVQMFRESTGVAHASGVEVLSAGWP